MVQLIRKLRARWEEWQAYGYGPHVEITPKGSVWIDVDKQARLNSEWYQRFLKQIDEVAEWSCK